jgi:hypothetical protein
LIQNFIPIQKSTMKKLLVFAFTPLLFTACSSGSEEKAPATDSIPAINETVSSEVTVSLPDSNTNAATTAGVVLNPPHGEPGHRCEIEVGKPLPADGKAPAVTANPAPAPASTPTITANPAPAGQPVTVSTNPTVTPAPAATKTAPGMNPPHGEPGHDCSIAVGAPLKK